MIKSHMSYIKKLIFLSLGLFWVGVYGYNFFIKPRLSFDIAASSNTSILLLYCSLCLFYTIMFMLNLFALLLVPLKQRKFTIILQKGINVLYWKPLGDIYENYFKKIPNIGFVLDFLGELIVGVTTKLGFSINTVILLDCIPRLILTFAFFLDVVIYAKISFSIPFVTVLGPWLFMFYLTLILLRDFASANKEFYELILVPTVSTNKIKLEYKIGYEDNTVYQIDGEEYYVESLNQIGEIWLTYYNLHQHVNSLLEIRKFVYPILYVLLYSMLSVVWLKFVLIQLTIDMPISYYIGLIMLFLALTSLFGTLYLSYGVHKNKFIFSAKHSQTW